MGGIKFLGLGKVVVEYIRESLGGMIGLDVEVEMENGMLCGVFVEFVDGEWVEELVFGWKVGV